jgi:hypothetical protein
VPAACSFLLIFAIFSFLQVRIAAIRRASDHRTTTLSLLRIAKSQQLTGNASADEAERAIQDYRDAYNNVEEMRNVIPGLARIAPPPGKEEDEGVAAARQFLGVESLEESESRTPNIREGGERKEQGLSPALSATLAIIVISQVLLLGLLSMDPMSSSHVLDYFGSESV